MVHQLGNLNGKRGRGEASRRIETIGKDQKEGPTYGLLSTPVLVTAWAFRFVKWVIHMTFRDRDTFAHVCPFAGRTLVVILLSVDTQDLLSNRLREGIPQRE